MGKRAAGVRSQQDRRRERAAVGDLRDGVVSQATLTKYEHRFNTFSSFAVAAEYNIRTVYELDVALCDYICELWHEGMSKGDASYTYAAVRHFLIHLSPPLHGAKRLLRAWDRLELPARALPFTPLLCLGVAGAFDMLGHRHGGLLCVVMFHCLLRTTEGLTLRRRQVLIAEDRQSAALALESTKTSVRHGVQEAVSVDCPEVVRLLEELCEGLLPGDVLGRISPTLFRKVFRRRSKYLSLEPTATVRTA